MRKNCESQPYLVCSKTGHAYVCQLVPPPSPPTLPNLNQGVVIDLVPIVEHLLPHWKPICIGELAKKKTFRRFLYRWQPCFLISRRSPGLSQWNRIEGTHNLQCDSSWSIPRSQGDFLPCKSLSLIRVQCSKNMFFWWCASFRVQGAPVLIF